MEKLSIATALVFLTACASQPEDIETSYVSTLSYEGYDCDQLSMEAERISSRTIALHGNLKETADNDAIQAGVGLVLLWPTLFFLEGGDGHQAQEYSRLKGERNAIEKVSVQKKCGITFQPIVLKKEKPISNYGDDPEIVKQELELKRLRKRQAADAELKRLKGEIAKITPIPPRKAAFIFPSKPVNVRFRSSTIRPDDIAVIIGNANYKRGKDIPNVTPAYADAAGIRNYIKQSLGIRDENIIFLKDASQADLIATFGSEKDPRGQLFNFVKAGNSRVFVYYSGHGAPGGEEGGSYLVPSNAQASLIDLNGYSLKTLYRNLGKLPAKSVTVVLEACFSGVSQSGSLSTKASPVYLKARETGIPPNITVIAAGAANQIASWEQDSSSGLFTKYFLKGMSGEADARPYGNGDGKVGYDELGRYFKKTLTYYARRYYGRDQTAQIVVGGLR